MFTTYQLVDFATIHSVSVKVVCRKDWWMQNLLEGH
jgi:hypothetical protein